MVVSIYSSGAYSQASSSANCAPSVPVQLLPEVVGSDYGQSRILLLGGALRLVEPSDPAYGVYRSKERVYSR